MKSLTEITFLLLLGAVQLGLPAADSTNGTTSSAISSITLTTITAMPTSAEKTSQVVTSNSTATYTTVSSITNASSETENMTVTASTTAESTYKTTLSSNNIPTHTVESTATGSDMEKTTTHPGIASNPIASQCSDFPTSVTVVVAAVIFCLLWSSITCICYRRKLFRLQKEKSHWDEENGTLKHDVNGRKISLDHFSGGNTDKDPSSFGRNIHSESENEGVDLDRNSDLYDVTDPDYEFADKEPEPKKPSKANEDDIIEDSEYDLLNDDDKVKRESDYACAEFKTSNMDLDCDTYDTTETFNRIKCAEKNENSEEATSTKDRLTKKSNEKDITPESKEPKDVNVDTISDKETSNQKEPDEKPTEKANKIDEAATAMPSENDIKLQEPCEKASKLEINSNTKASTLEYELVQVVQDQSETGPKENSKETSMTNMETTSTKDRSNEEDNKKKINTESKEDVKADTISDKGTPNQKEHDKKPAEKADKIEERATIMPESKEDANDDTISNKETSNQKEPDEKPAEKANKIDEAATIMPSDNDIKLQETCEKASKLEINSNTKAPTCEYELVQIVEDQSETGPKENSEETSMTNLDEK